MANPDGFNINTGVGSHPGVIHVLLATIGPAAGGTSSAWFDIGPHRYEGTIYVSGSHNVGGALTTTAFTTTVGYEVHGISTDVAPTIGTVGKILGSTMTTEDHYDFSNPPRYMRVFSNTNTTTVGTVQVFYLGSAPWGGRH